VLLVDDHPAVRAGLISLLRREPGLVVVGTADHAAEAVIKIRVTWPDVVLVDYQLPDEDGLVLCQRLKSLPDPPAVLVYSAYADGSLAVAAQVAGAQGFLNKAAPVDELVDALRIVARGGTFLPPRSPAAMEEVGASLDEDDLPILGMIVNGTTRGEICEVLNMRDDELTVHVASIVDRIKIVPSRT
jgi:DNA-binding NarL/FixJ family response regulator